MEKIFNRKCYISEIINKFIKDYFSLDKKKPSLEDKNKTELVTDHKILLHFAMKMVKQIEGKLKRIALKGKIILLLRNGNA